VGEHGAGRVLMKPEEPRLDESAQHGAGGDGRAQKPNDGRAGRA
jgi:hypothetical protein